MARAERVGELVHKEGKHTNRGQTCMVLPAVAYAPGAGDHRAAQGWEWSHSRYASQH